MTLSTKPKQESDDDGMRGPAAYPHPVFGIEKPGQGSSVSRLQHFQFPNGHAESIDFRDSVCADRVPVAKWHESFGNESVFMGSQFPEDALTVKGRKEWGRLLSGRHGRRLRRILHSGSVESGRLLRNILRPRLSYVTKNIESIMPGQVVLEGGITLRSRKLSKVLAAGRRVVCFVATIGHELDRKVGKLSSSGRYADEYLLDRVGSLSIEDFVQAFQQEMAQRLLRNRRRPTVRFSPGYCDWPLAEQEKVFALVDTTQIGVSLTQTLLMRPRKSVSGVFGILERTNGREPEMYNPCGDCDKKSCLERRAERSFSFDEKHNFRFTA